MEETETKPGRWKRLVIVIAAAAAAIAIAVVAWPGPREPVKMVDGYLS